MHMEKVDIFLLNKSILFLFIFKFHVVFTEIG